MNVAYQLQRAAAARPDHLALVQGERTLTLAELYERVARLAGYLRGAGLAPGDRIGVLQHNGPALLESMLAAFHGGYCVVPVNARAAPVEGATILADAGVAAVVYGADHREHVEAADRDGLVSIGLEPDTSAGIALDDAIAAGPALPVEPVAPDEVAWLFYTSGTTGASKGAMLSHRNLIAMTTAFLGDLRRLDGDAVVVHAAPLTHGGGLYALPAIVRGVTQVITTSRSYAPEELLAIVAEHRATDIAFLAPTMLKWLTEAQTRVSADTSSLENVVYGGGPMYHDDLLAAMDRFGSVFSQIYGQAEAPMTISRLTREDHAWARANDPDVLLSAGRAYTAMEAGVADESGQVLPEGHGEIVARGDAVMRGYWGREEATAETLRDGWLHTGDVGRIGSDGLVYLLDRSKDVIITGGANVYPREVEEVILEHPRVRQVAVVGAPDDEWGERVVSILVLDSDAAEPAAVEAEVVAMCRERLAGYKLPRQFDWRDELPTNAYGKVLKRELRAEFWRGRERAI